MNWRIKIYYYLCLSSFHCYKFFVSVRGDKNLIINIPAIKRRIENPSDYPNKLGGLKLLTNLLGFSHLRVLRIRIHTKLVEDLIHKNLQKEFTTFLYMKYCYTNSCFFNYSINSVAKKSKLSRTAVKRNVSIFLERGWCILHNNNLIFKDFSEIIFQEGVFNAKGNLCKKTNYTIIKIKHKEKKPLLKLLYLELFQNKLRQVERMAGKANDLLDPCGRFKLQSHKNAIKFWCGRKRSEIFQLNENSIALSLSSISKLFNCSVAKAQQLMKFFIDNKLVDAIKEQIRCLGQTGKFFDLPKDCFFHKGYIFQQPCTQYVVKEQQGVISYTKKTY